MPSPKDHEAWRVSLHGGHSSDFCDHATSPLHDMLEAAVAFGYRTFGLAEHAPRYTPHYLYAEEVAMGWDVAKIQRDFERYAQAASDLTEAFAGRLEILRGFEAEVVPSDTYVEKMLGLRRQFAFDFMVGSVHWIDDEIFDYGQEAFNRVVANNGGLERFALRYYDTVATMVRALKPDVVGHLDILRKYVRPEEVATPPICRAAERALQAISDVGSILDVNTSGFRRGLERPFPDGWLLELAFKDYGIGVCFGDDSHSVEQVGAGVPEARDYLLRRGIGQITVLTRDAGAVVRKAVALE